MSEYYLGNVVFDITNSLKDYNYTLNSVVNLNRIINSTQFEEMASETILKYLQDQMEIVSFGDHLKRFIYEKTGMPDNFRDVPEDYYVAYISDSFAMNRAPHAFTPVKTRWHNIIKRWIRADSVKRDTVFLLGFGLNMTDKEVSSFLTKVIKEQDFRFSDPRETVFWYCYHHGLPYSKALELLPYYEHPEPPEEDAGSDEFWSCIQGNALKIYLSNPCKIKGYLAYLQHCGPQEDAAYHEFDKLYERAVAAARKLTREGNPHPEKAEKLTGAYDIESILCSGTPRTDSKNLTPVTRSTLSRQFEKKRMSRQHLSRLLRREAPVERYDIITLLFLVYTVSVEPEWPTSRYMLFIDEANEILRSCSMMEIYPVNPYESFVLMCLLTEEPLAVYNDVWEMSYAQPETAPE